MNDGLGLGLFIPVLHKINQKKHDLNLERHHLFVDPDHFLDPEGAQLKGTFIKIAGIFNG